MGFFFGGFFKSGIVGFNVEFGGVNGLCSSIDEDVECKVEEILRECTFL